jgi:hypothetical protein
LPFFEALTKGAYFFAGDNPITSDRALHAGLCVGIDKLSILCF